MKLFPGGFRLHQNYPNPFNPQTTIRYQIPSDGLVVIKMYDVLGREVRTLVDEHQKAGYHMTTLDASRLASGVYFYRMVAGNYVNVKKLLVMK
jgi:hypothetical protein